MTRRRSRLSATAPDQRDSSRIGSEVEARTRATIWGDGVSEAISHDAPTDWISPPKLDAMLAIHTARKIPNESGDLGARSAIPLQMRASFKDAKAAERRPRPTLPQPL